MTYKVRCTKTNEAGIYALSYGRGKTKLVATLVKYDEPSATGDQWSVRDTDISGKLKRDAVKAWGEWAAETYEVVGHEVANGHASAAASVTPKKIGPPSLKDRKKKDGPPPFKRSSAPASARNRPSHPAYEADHNDVTDGDENPYLADFLGDQEFFERSAPTRHWTITPLGVLDEVFNWMQANLPFTATLEYPWVRVTKTLQRYFPNDEKYQQTGAE